MAAVSSTMKERTTGTVSTKKVKSILPEWATWECYRTDVTGVSCYSSKDLLNWKFEGIVLPAVKDDQGHDLHTSKVLERPKVIYNPKTKKIRDVGTRGKCRLQQGMRRSSHQ